MNNPIEIEDHTRVDKFMQARRRAMVMSQIWKPMGMGAVGAALVIGAVWVILPKISYREVIVPRVTLKDVEVPTISLKPIIVPDITLKPIDIPVPATIPESNAPPAPLPPLAPPYAARTPEEKPFVDTPEYRNAIYRGRIIHSKDGKALYFEDGKLFIAAHWDADTHQVIGDPNIAIDSDPYVGDLGMCIEEKDHANFWNCTAMHHGKEVNIPNKPNTTKAATTSNQPI